MSRALLTRLGPAPVLGTSMANVQLLRLDQQDQLAPGNKWYKLRNSLALAQQRGLRRLVSFGGAWSNHLHALAAVGYVHGFSTVGIVRGEEEEADSAMIADARAWGMEIIRVSRTEYRRRNQPEYLQAVERRFAPCLVIPEGGANEEGARGCMEIASLVRRHAPAVRRVVLPVGTGTTLAGIAAGLGEGYQVLGVSALKGARDLEDRVHAALRACPQEIPAHWQILHEDHCGGFARVSDELRDFMLAFESVHGVPLEPVYTGKMLLAIHRRLCSGEWDMQTPILAIHTGGLQGRRGYSW